MHRSEDILRQLRRSRTCDLRDYVRHIFVTAALARRLAIISDPWDYDQITHICSLPGAVLCAREGASAGRTEVHLWWDGFSPVARKMTERMSGGLRPAVISLNGRQTGLMRAAPPVRRAAHLDEALYWRRAAADEGRGGPAHPQETRVVTLRGDGAMAVARTGAYPNDVLDILAGGGAGTDAAVLTDAAGDWLTRCHLEPLDRDVSEVCGLHTHPQHLARGCARRLLHSPPLRGRSLILLTRWTNRAARRTAASAGFSLLDRPRKLITSGSGRGGGC